MEKMPVYADGFSEKWQWSQSMIHFHWSIDGKNASWCWWFQWTWQDKWICYDWFQGKWGKIAGKTMGLWWLWSMPMGKLQENTDGKFPTFDVVEGEIDWTNLLIWWGKPMVSGEDFPRQTNRVNEASDKIWVYPVDYILDRLDYCRWD